MAALRGDIRFRYLKQLTYLERKKCYGLNKKILFKKQSFDLEVKVPRRSLWYKKGVKLAFPYYIWILIMSPLRTKADILV
jgi:hypothetical protein